MQDAGNETREVTASSAVGRRKFLVKAVVAGSVAWAVPAIITMEPAGAAELTSPPPTPPIEVQKEAVIDPGGATTGPAVEPEVEVRGALAITGAPITRLAGAGAAAIAGGGALHRWSARAGRSGAASSAPVAPALCPPQATE